MKNQFSRIVLLLVLVTSLLFAGSLPNSSGQAQSEPTPTVLATETTTLTESEAQEKIDFVTNSHEAFELSKTTFQSAKEASDLDENLENIETLIKAIKDQSFAAETYISVATMASHDGAYAVLGLDDVLDATAREILYTTGPEELAIAEALLEKATAEPETATFTSTALACLDGELLFVHAADAGDTLARLPVGEAERPNIIEMSWADNREEDENPGFADVERAVLVTPQLGPVWMVNLNGLQTIGTRGFCGTNKATANWAVQAHVPSLQQASRDTDGSQPDYNEIGVYLLDYEAGTLTVVKPGLDGQAERLLEYLDVSFHEGTTHSSVPITIVE